MARTYLTIHDAPLELYIGLPADEQTAQGSVWKTIKTPSIEITVFRNEPVVSDDA